MPTPPQKPLVTVGMPVYNGAPRIGAAIDYIRAQTYGPLEIIVADNCSTDGTEEIVRQYMMRDSRIRYIRQPENLGQIKNFLTLLQEARGEYFMWAADDDRWDPKFVETLANLLDKRPDCGVAMSSYQNVSPDGRVASTKHFTGDEDLCPKNSYAVYRKIVLDGPQHHFLYGLHRRKVLLRFFERPTVECIRWDRVFMAETALATRFCSAEPVLFFKTTNPVSIASRYANDAVGRPFFKAFPYGRYVRKLLTWPLTSRVIPLNRKWYIFVPWCIVLWRYKRRLWREAGAYFFKLRYE